MPDRFLRINAYTSLNMADAELQCAEGTAETYGIVNITAARDTPKSVNLQLEIDNTELETVAPHADIFSLSPEEARTLAMDLNKYADRVEAVPE